LAVGAPDYRVNWQLVKAFKALLDLPHWASLRAEDKDIYHSGYVAPGETDDYTLYTVPAGRKLYVNDLQVSSQVKGVAAVMLAGDPQLNSYMAAHSSVVSNLRKPKRLVEGEAVRVIYTNMDAAGGDFTFVVLGWEEEVGGGSAGSPITSSQVWKRGMWNVLRSTEATPGRLEIFLRGARIVGEVRVEVESPYAPGENVIYEEEVELA